DRWTIAAPRTWSPVDFPRHPGDAEGVERGDPESGGGLVKRSNIRVAVVYIEGTNCEDESVAYFRHLGAQAEKVHLKQLTGDVPAQVASHGERSHVRLYPDPEEGPDCHLHLGSRRRQAAVPGGPREADSERTHRQRSSRVPIRRRSWEVCRIPVEPERDHVQPRGPVQPGGERLRRAAAPGALLLPPSASGLDAAARWGPGVRRREGGLRTVPAPRRTTL